MKATNQRLIAWHSEAQETKRADSIWAHLLRSRIDQFYKNNEIKIESIIKKADKINRKYYEHEHRKSKDGEILMNEPTIMKFTEPNPKNPNKRPEPILLEGMKQEDFDKEWDELMKIEVEVMF